MLDMVLHTPLIILKMKMNKKWKTQSQKRHDTQHRELVSILFRFPKHKLLSLCLKSVKMKNQSSYSFVHSPQKHMFIFYRDTCFYRLVKQNVRLVIQNVCQVQKLLKLAQEFKCASPPKQNYLNVLHTGIILLLRKNKLILFHPNLSFSRY